MSLKLKLFESLFSLPEMLRRGDYCQYCPIRTHFYINMFPGFLEPQVSVLKKQ